MDTTPFAQNPQLKTTNNAMCLQNSMDSRTRTRCPSLKNRGKRVRFTDAPTKVAVVERRNEEERTHSFLSFTEMKSFQIGRLESVEAARANVFDDRNHCLRGIEQFTSALIQRNIMGEKKMLYEMIFAEQERQKLAGIKDDVSIQELSEMCTTYAKNRALKAAASDAASVLARDSPRKRKRVAFEVDESPLFPQSRIMKNAFAVISPRRKISTPLLIRTSTQRILLGDQPLLKRSRIQRDEQRDRKVSLYMNQRTAMSA